MKLLNLIIQILNNLASKPEYGSGEAAGLDLKAAINNKVIIKSMDYTTVPTGLIIEIPNGFEGQIRPRSGLASKNGISVLNSPGTIDSDYRGEIKVILINLGQDNFQILPGMKVAQLIVAPIYKAKINYVKKIDSKTKRGKKGFGSTGL